MIRLFCRPPYSRSVLLGVLPRSGNGATNPTQRSHSILSAPLNHLQTLASLRPLLVVSLCCLSWPPAEALARRRRHSSKRSSGATAPLQWCCNRRGPSSHRRPDFHPLFFLILGILRVRRLWRLVTGGQLGLADVLQLGKACQRATKSQLRVSPAILGRISSKTTNLPPCRGEGGARWGGLLKWFGARRRRPRRVHYPYCGSSGRLQLALLKLKMRT